MKKEQIIEVLMKELRGIYCNNCRFNNIDEDEAIEIYDYYGCDGCCRKCMGWEISTEKAEKIANKILNNN